MFENKVSKTDYLTKRWLFFYQLLHKINKNINKIKVPKTAGGSKLKFYHIPRKIENVIQLTNYSCRTHCF